MSYFTNGSKLPYISDSSDDLELEEFDQITIKKNKNKLRTLTNIEPIRQLTSPCILDENEKIGEIMNFFRRYRVLKKICQGAFATVYTVVPRPTDMATRESATKPDSHFDKLSDSTESSEHSDKLAVKVISKTHFHRTKEPSSPRANIEAVIHQSVNHPNIIKLHEYCEDYEQQLFLMEYVETDLFEKLKTTNLSHQTISRFTEQLTCAVEYCHQYNIIHRDIKSENILVTHDNKIKLCDFGWATRNKVSHRQCGTPEYMAPEMVIGFGYDYRIDIWSIGIVLYEMYYNFTPFKIIPDDDDNNLDLHRNIIYRSIDTALKAQPLTSHHCIPNYGKDLVKKLLSKNPIFRPNYVQIYEHPFISDREAIGKEKKERVTYGFPLKPNP